MNTGNKIGVAISTTGDEHRLGFLETCVSAWRKALPLGSVIAVTVDGDADAGDQLLIDLRESMDDTLPGIE